MPDLSGDLEGIPDLTDIDEIPADYIDTSYDLSGVKPMEVPAPKVPELPDLSGDLEGIPDLTDINVSENDIEFDFSADEPIVVDLMEYIAANENAAPDATALQAVSEQIDELGEQVASDIKNVTPQTSNEQIFNILENLVSHQVLSENYQRAKQAYEEAKQREQSLANRLISGVAIGAGGIGGMQLASALAEQRADADAERDMTAYLATFRCDYGAGRNISGGEVNVQLPGANVLLPLYNEYTTLAADLKTRKEVLGMAPGIESEVILDAATSGLYDNAATGITEGAYTSISRALMNPNGADAAEWAAQTEQTAQQVKTGGTVAGAGLGVGLVGNIAENVVHNAQSNKNESQK